MFDCCNNNNNNKRYYDGSVGSQFLFKARTQSLEVNSRTYRWNENKEKRCSVSLGDASHFCAKFTLQHYHGKTINGRNL